MSRLSVLGPLEVGHGATVVDLGSARHREVLAALVVDAGHTVTTSTLLDRVWGEGVRGATTANLHAIISRLRARLRDSAPGIEISTQPAGYRLESDRRAIDALRFADLLVDARRRFAEGDAPTARRLVGEALGLWRGAAYGDIRAGFAEVEAGRLEEQRLATLELAAELDLVLGNHSALVETLPGLVAEHPLRERLRGSLMVALYRSGRQVEALRLYDDAREVLADELGLDPGPELQRLHGMVLRQDPELLGSAPTGPGRQSRSASRHVEVTAEPDLPDEAAMVGRHEELADAVAAVARGATGRPTITAVFGEAGIGKTRLAEETARRAEARGITVVWGRCWDHSGAPAFWPWEQAFSALLSVTGADEARRAAAGRAAAAAVLMPELSDLAEAARVSGGSPEASRVRLYDGVTAFLEAVTSERPVLLVLEDLHWADPESVELTEYVAANLRHGSLCLLLTVRSPSEQLVSPGDQLAAALARRPQVQRIDLQGLDVEQVRQLVTERIGDEVGITAAESLRERTDGNPFYLTELVRLLREERTLLGRADVPVPTGIRAVIEQRLRHLAPEDRQMLSAAAVIGRSFDLDLLAEVTARSAADLLDGLDRAARAGVLRADSAPTRQRFTHALVQETLTLTTGPMRRAALHAKIAEALERRHHADLDQYAAVLAHHHAEAGAVGDPEKAVRFSLAAGAAAEARFGYQEAERHLRRALELVDAVPGTAAALLELETRVRLGSLLTLLLGYNAPEVAAERQRALELSAVTGSTEHVLSALWGTWGNALVSGDFRAADAVCEQIAAAARRTGAPVLALALHQSRGQVRWHQGRLAEAAADLRAALPLADELHDELRLDLFIQHPAAAARAWLCVVLAMQGRVTESDRLAEENQRIADSIAHPFTSNYVHILEAWRAVWLDRPEQASQQSGLAMATSATHGFAQLRAFALPPSGWARARRGEPRAGADEVRLALDIFGTLPSGHMFGHLMLGLLADIQLMSGEPEQALETVRRGLAESERTGERFHLSELHRIQALALEQLDPGTSDVAVALQRAQAIASEQGAHLFVERARTALESRVHG